MNKIKIMPLLMLMVVGFVSAHVGEDYFNNHGMMGGFYGWGMGFFGWLVVVLVIVVLVLLIIWLYKQIGSGKIK